MENLKLNAMKENYNKLLERFWNADKFFEEHKEAVNNNKLVDGFKTIQKDLENLLTEIQKIQDVSSEEILSGFKIEDEKIKKIEEDDMEL